MTISGQLRNCAEDVENLNFATLQKPNALSLQCTFDFADAIIDMLKDFVTVSRRKIHQCGTNKCAVYIVDVDLH